MSLFDEGIDDWPTHKKRLTGMKGWQYMMDCPGGTQNLFTITLLYRHTKKVSRGWNRSASSNSPPHQPLLYVQSYKVHAAWYIHYGVIYPCPSVSSVYGLSLGKRVRSAEAVREALERRFEGSSSPGRYDVGDEEEVRVGQRPSRARNGTD